MSQHYRNLAVALLTVVLLPLACEDTRYSTKPNPIPGPYPIETEISLSPDRQFIYFVTTDSNTPGNTGIYRAKRSNPVREKILAGNSLHSPVISFDNQLLAYLKSGRINYYRLTDQTEFPSALPDSFASIIFINDSQIVAGRDTSIYLVDEHRIEVTYLTRGWDPTLVSRGTFLYIDGSKMNYRIMENNIYGDTLTRQTVATDAVAHWPTRISAYNRLVYGIEWLEQKYIYSVVPGQNFTYIDSSFYSKPYLVDFNLILFTGLDGRIYSSDFAGTISVPFVPEAGTESIIPYCFKIWH